uniref:PK domain-containing protein n=1 Tax=Steinernema glaseri TaxID=37863 RepID=A0A1I8AH95_9BILA
MIPNNYRKIVPLRSVDHRLLLQMEPTWTKRTPNCIKKDVAKMGINTVASPEMTPKKVNVALRPKLLIMTTVGRAPANLPIATIEKIQLSSKAVNITAVACDPRTFLKERLVSVFTIERRRFRTVRIHANNCEVEEASVSE